MDPVAITKRKHIIMLILQLKMTEAMYFVYLVMLVALVLNKKKKKGVMGNREDTITRHTIKAIHLQKMVFDSDKQCLGNCRMDQKSFSKLCHLLRIVGGLKDNMDVEEMLCNLLHIIGHHKKNGVVKRQIARSSETISRKFHEFLNVVLMLLSIMFANQSQLVIIVQITDESGSR